MKTYYLYISPLQDKLLITLKQLSGVFFCVYLCITLANDSNIATVLFLDLLAITVLGVLQQQHNSIHLSTTLSGFLPFSGIAHNFKLLNILTSTNRTTVSQNGEVITLTRQQQERANYLRNTYDDNSAQLVLLLDTRGKNSWLMVDRKITLINQATHELQHYHDMVSDNFEVGQTYSRAGITSIIADIRRDLGMPAYFTRLQANCEADFLNLFLVDDVYKECKTNADGIKVFNDFVGYMPTFKLKPQD